MFWRRGIGSDIEFATAVIIFMTGFWFIYLQLSDTMLIKTHRTDFTQQTAGFLSDKIIKESGTPANWTNFTTMTVLGLACYDGKDNAGVLDSRKLDSMDGEDCSSTKMPVIEGLWFNVLVYSKDGALWNCTRSTPPIGSAVVSRPVYVRYANGTYMEGRAEVVIWSA